MLPEKTSLINIVHDLISQLERQSQTVQDLIQESTINSKQQQRTEANLAASEKKLQEMRQSLDNAQREIESFKVDIKDVKVKFESDVKSLKNQKVKLEQQLKISEHRVKAKETLLERLQNKLQQQIDKEEFSKSRNQDVFRKIQQREPRKTSPSDLKSIELIGMYENERSHLNDEIAQLRNQVQELCSEVREKENIISRASGGGINIKDHDSLLHRLEQARFEQEQVTKQLRLQERSIHEKMKNIEAELQQSKQVIQELREENSNLHLEVEARPTIRDYKATQRRALLLERQLSSQTLAMKEANNIEELRKYIGTAELIRRDKTNAKLQLNRLNTLPKDTCVEIIQDICRQLELTDITLIGPSVAKMISVVQAIPRLEKFVRDVCTIAASKPASSLESVLHTLSRWKQNIGAFTSLQKYAADSFQILASRREKSFQPVESATVYSQALKAIEELVEFESQFLEEQNMYQLAAENVQKQPNLLVNRMVQHFRHLFGVKTMDGVFPMINEVFLFVNEMNNALASIKTTLGLAQDVSVSNALIALKDHLETVRPRPMPRQTENYVVAKNEEVAGLAQVRQNHMILKELKHVLGAQTFEELVPRAQRLMELLSISIQNTTN
ncbi:hypothetical protein LEN26_015235 [Aphanomyces euteiches]|nr:hypothetical protein AeMF1_021824 [Aphanomyces euteiches]KAH9103599.1 hypothetical protein AeMF1_020055 [Aphanomyces euteiches]KAH9103671.1 hypothetical protein LEN26_015235 [Aphanomyces euteiches]KAH9119746.1 hypothetical protein AeMF1_007759 [Aphanomyces euteiches]KAH9122312.1 hypothetical protein AeMF1_006311 [Aphanomyces euteiches]